MIGPLRRAWKWFWSPSKRLAWGAIFLVGGIAGTLFWGGFIAAMEYSSTLEFCTSCHEMDQLVYQEYKKTIHYANRTGVRVICSDCHVPKPWGPKVWRKIQASNELLHKALGSVDTPEKFETKRLEMAEHVWAYMEATDSRECRNCHDFEAMDFHKQSRRGAEKMSKAMKDGKETCIDCHKGVAHKLPDDYEE